MILCGVSSAYAAIDVEILGVSDTQVKDNIKIHLSNLSLPKNCRMNNDLSSTLDEKISEASRAFGYYNVDVLSTQIATMEKCKKLRVSLNMGPRATIAKLNLKVEGDGASDPDFIKALNATSLRLGAPLEHSNYERLKSTLRSIALNKGYFDSAFTKNEMLVDVSSNQATVNLLFDSKKRYQFGELKIPDDLIAAELVKDVVPFKFAEPYRASKLGEFNQNLGQTGYFQQVVARPLVVESEDLKVPIEIVAVPKPRDIFDVGGGASTDTGPRFRFGWHRPWVNRHGHSMQADAYVSAPRQTASLEYKIPVEDPLKNYINMQLGYEAIDDNDSNIDTVSLAIQRHWANPESPWNKIGSLQYRQSTFVQASEPEVTTRLLMPGFTLSRLRSRGGLDINWGDLQQVTIEGASKDLLSDIDLARITYQTKWLRSFGEHRFLARAEFGALITNEFDSVPSDLRYFAGGDQSVRGHKYRTLAPKEQTGDMELLGGKYLNVASLEYSYPVADEWRAIVFSDVGGASNEPFERLAYGFGIGASWLSPVGPIRFYLARGTGDFGNDTQFHFSMGPAL
ncbi:autotransporter assembly complex protein TamA [Aliiglaciecola sp. M165]|uniref:autotransporter assembly complex protein TamA n=1 Tax=Aliiglaciecola sp. M165 TaxID=2593649 RepID=UPI0011802E1C|nr:autotransporter assembly complex family protein [Aliiglaciecola sp. M165]TRY33484.1 outer membrane protein assembly factor [Aliiglaciecola sp. M165]